MASAACPWDWVRHFAIFPDMLPRHDDIGLLRRIFEAGCIATATILLVFHSARFFALSSSAHWWSLIFVPVGMAAADFLSGLVHWTADTWGSETMPVLGRRFVHPFRVHHVNPDDFLRRRFLDTNGDVAMIVMPFLVGALCIPLDGPLGLSIAALMLGFRGVGLLTNQVHQWAHMSRPPRLVRLLQDCRIILSRQAHAQHHCAPHITSYCIATGWCNDLLNWTGFFRRLERAVSRLTGLIPRVDDASFTAEVQRDYRAPLPWEAKHE